MEDIKIAAFEKLIVDACNNIPLSNRVKYYVLKDISQKLLAVSEQEIQIMEKEMEKERENGTKIG